MNKAKLIKKITLKKRYSQLPKKDVELAFAKFDSDKYIDEEKVKLTRELLGKVFGAFGSSQILSQKNRDADWVLGRHLSTRERLPSYKKVYSKILKGMDRKINVIDLGAGVNGFSYKYFKDAGYNLNYVAVEAMGQFVDLMDNYFKKEKINGKPIHLSLFELEKIKKIIKKTSKPRVVFLFKVIDSLEILERNYSKKLLLEIVPLVDRVVISFATKSILKREKFKVKRTWIINFLKDNFNILDDFELGDERYLVFEKKKHL